MASQLDLIVLGLGGLLAVLYLFATLSLAAPRTSDPSSQMVALSLLPPRQAVPTLSPSSSLRRSASPSFTAPRPVPPRSMPPSLPRGKIPFRYLFARSRPREYEFDKLDQMPEDSVAVFVMATYGEGEPTDNAVGLMEFIENDTPEFSNGSERLENLNYVIFGLGNRTYEHFNAVARKLDSRLQSLGAKRIGERGEGDDDKSMEEDYLAWKDSMFEALASSLNFEEGGGGDVPDFKVTELAEHPRTRSTTESFRLERCLAPRASTTQEPV